MKPALFAGVVSAALNLLILAAFIPFQIGFTVPIVLQIVGWTLAGAVGAAITLFLLAKYAVQPLRTFILLAVTVFFLSLIPIYLRMGILHDVPPAFFLAIKRAVITMHITDSFIISTIVLAYARKLT